MFVWRLTIILLFKCMRRCHPLHPSYKSTREYGFFSHISHQKQLLTVNLILNQHTNLVLDIKLTNMRHICRLICNFDTSKDYSDSVHIFKEQDDCVPFICLMFTFACLDYVYFFLLRFWVASLLTKEILLQADNCYDKEVIYAFLDSYGIGKSHTDFYISYALHLESKNKFKAANQTFELGISRYCPHLLVYLLC